MLRCLVVWKREKPSFNFVFSICLWYLVQMLCQFFFAMINVTVLQYFVNLRDITTHIFKEVYWLQGYRTLRKLPSDLSVIILLSELRVPDVCVTLLGVREDIVTPLPT